MTKKLLIFICIFIGINTAFAKKEQLLFDLKFSFAKGGEAVLTISDTVFKGKPAILYSFVGRTTGITDKLFGVDDAYETIVDAKTNPPLKSIRNIKKKKYQW